LRLVNPRESRSGTVHGIVNYFNSPLATKITPPPPVCLAHKSRNRALPRDAPRRDRKWTRELIIDEPTLDHSRSD